MGIALATNATVPVLLVPNFNEDTVGEYDSALLFIRLFAD